jgi:hypothetical protein
MTAEVSMYSQSIEAAIEDLAERAHKVDQYPQIFGSEQSAYMIILAADLPWRSRAAWADSAVRVTQNLERYLASRSIELDEPIDSALPTREKMKRFVQQHPELLK